jgi:hypothetical protein
MADGQYRTMRQIREAVRETIPDADADSIANAVRFLRERPPEGMAMESRRATNIHQYRLSEAEPAVMLPVADVARLAADIRPIIKELKTWGKASEWAQSPAALRLLAARLEKLIAPFQQNRSPQHVAGDRS